MKKNSLGNIILGLCLMAAAVIYGGNALGAWQFSFFFQGWWTLFIIVPCVVGIFNHGPKLHYLVFLAVGVGLLLSAQGLVASAAIRRLIFPAALLIIGLWFLFRNSFGRDSEAIRAITARGGRPDYTAVFSGQRVSFAGQVFPGATVTSVFGGIDLDLRGAVINDDIVVDATVMFGGLDILTPPGLRVVLSSTPIFGGVEDKSMGPIPGSAYHTLYLNATCVFGGVEVK